MSMSAPFVTNTVQQSLMASVIARIGDGSGRTTRRLVDAGIDAVTTDTTREKAEAVKEIGELLAKAVRENYPDKVIESYSKLLELLTASLNS